MKKLSKKELDKIEKVYQDVKKGCGSPKLILTPDGWHTLTGFYPHSSTKSSYNENSDD